MCCCSVIIINNNKIITIIVIIIITIVVTMMVINIFKNHFEGITVIISFDLSLGHFKILNIAGLFQRRIYPGWGQYDGGGLEASAAPVLFPPPTPPPRQAKKGFFCW